MRKTYLWIEDRERKAGYTFWCTFMNQLYPKVVVESKKNSSELVKAVKKLEDSEDRYIIVLDNSFDNQQIYQERKMLKKYVDMKPNVRMIDIICFEYILLEFDKLIEWIYAPEDEFLAKRADAINAREALVKSIGAGCIDYKSIYNIMKYDRKLDSYNVEQLSAKLLFDLTRNTGFEVSKGMIGACWLTSCCEWFGRQANDICGLDHQHLDLHDKMKTIYTGTSLCKEFTNLGLEVLE